MQLPTQFKEQDQCKPFSVTFDELIIDDVSKGKARVSASYNRAGNCIFHLGEFFPPDFRIFDCKIELKYKESDDPIKLLVTRRSLSSEAGEPIVEALLASAPLPLVDNSKSQRFEAVILSAPDFISNPIQLIDENGTHFEIYPPQTNDDLACFVKSDFPLAASNFSNPLKPLMQFLNFAKGGFCGLGNVFAYDKGDEISFRLLGFFRNDPGERETNWFDIEVQADLPEVFLLFSTAYSDQLTRLALDQTINFYRASNVSRRSSVELAMIASHSALEAIVNFVLTHRAGWSKSMMNNRTIAFSDRNRAAARHLGLHAELLKESPKLREFAASNNDIDAFEIISRFRNKLVHQDTKSSATGVQLHEAWLISQWLVEVFVFGVIGYSGKIIDRRVYSGFRGTTCQIPIS